MLLLKSTYCHVPHNVAIFSVFLSQKLHWSELCHERVESGDGPDTEEVRVDRRPRLETQDNSSAGASLDQWHPHQDQICGSTSVGEVPAGNTVNLETHSSVGGKSEDLNHRHF